MTGEHGGYIPTERKRTFVAKDEYSRERIRTIKEIQKEMNQALYPPIAFAVVVFGSLTKGKVLNKETAAKTDVDLQVYVTASDIEQYLQAKEYGTKTSEEPYVSMVKELEAMKADYPANKDRLWSITLSFKTHLQTFFKKRLGTEVGLFVDMLNSNIGEQLCHEIEQIDRLLEPESWDEFLEAGEFSFSGQALYVAKFFALDVGGGMKQHRRAFMQYLYEQYQSRPEEIKKIWEMIRRCDQWARYTKSFSRASATERTRANYPLFFFADYLKECRDTGVDRFAGPAYLFLPQEVEDAFHYYRITS